MPEVLYSDIGRRIADLRKESHMTQKTLAGRLDISVKHCSEVERGISRLSLEKLVEVSEIFGCSLDYLVLGGGNASFQYFMPPKMMEDFLSKDIKKMTVLRDYLKMYDTLKQ